MSARHSDIPVNTSFGISVHSPAMSAVVQGFGQVLRAIKSSIVPFRHRSRRTVFVARTFRRIGTV